MADEQTPETPEVQPAEVTEDDLRNLIGEVLDERLSTLSEGISGLADSIFDKIKGEGTANEDGLLEKIGGMIDEKLKGFGGNGNGTTETKDSGERIPKLRIFK